MTKPPAPTPAQMEAIVDIVTTRRGVTRLHGYAGTGKTAVVAAHSIRQMEDEGMTVQTLAPTGKAARVLRAKGLHSASTIHSYLYTPSKRETQDWRAAWDELVASLAATQKAADPLLMIETAGPETPTGSYWDDLAKAAGKKLAKKVERVRKVPRWKLAFTASGAISYYEDYGTPAADVLVIDESSMVSAAVAFDLGRTGSRLVFVGDPAQLPPVKADRSRDAMGDPHHLLTEVHRQKAGSDVLALATQIRTTETPYVDATRAKALRDLEDYDQVLCWRNATREQVNAEIRRRLGRKDPLMPEEGDRLICLKNTKPQDPDARQWMNGEQVTVRGVSASRSADMVSMEVEDDDRIIHEVHSPLETFAGHKAEQAYADRSWRSADPAFAYGYGVTVHKSQGSEWPRVLLVDESPGMISMTERREGRRAALEQARAWLYTGVTRAADEVHVVRDLRAV